MSYQDFAKPSELVQELSKKRELEAYEKHRGEIEYSLQSFFRNVGIDFSTTPLWRDAVKVALEYAEKKEVPPDDVRIVWKFLLQKEERN